MSKKDDLIKELSMKAMRKVMRKTNTSIHAFILGYIGDDNNIKLVSSGMGLSLRDETIGVLHRVRDHIDDLLLDLTIGTSPGTHSKMRESVLNVDVKERHNEEF